MNNPKHYIITANDLYDGDVIYLGDNERWVRFIHQAKWFDSAETAEQVQKKYEKDGSLVGVYFAEVEIGEGVIEPIHFREAFRSNGPSNYFHGKQEIDHVSI